MRYDTLKDAIQADMMDAGEVLELTELVDSITECEDDLGYKHSKEELYKAWVAAADYTVDAHIENVHDSYPHKWDGKYEGEFDTLDEWRGDAEARWERQRPRNKRTAQIMKMFKATDSTIKIGTIRRMGKRNYHVQLPVGPVVVTSQRLADEIVAALGV